MQTTPLLLLVLLIVTGCSTVAEKESPLARYTGVYVAELTLESAKQWDTLDVRKAGTANVDSFLIFYSDGYIKKLPDGQWTEHKFIRDTFPAIFRQDYNCLFVGDPLSMPLDSVNGQPVRSAPSRPMHIDTDRKSASFGGLAYKKIK